MRFLDSEDIVEMMVMSAVAERWRKERKELDRQLAIEIINTLSKSMGSKSG